MGTEASLPSLWDPCSSSSFTFTSQKAARVQVPSHGIDFRDEAAISENFKYSPSFSSYWGI